MSVVTRLTPKFRDWRGILDHAKAIVESYSTMVAWKQCFYRLVADGTLRSTDSDMVMFSRESAKARRAGTFPEFIDQAHEIHRRNMWTDLPDAASWLRDQYRRERTEGQPVTLCIVVEKSAMVEQFLDWFGDLGIPIVATSGWCGQSYLDEVRRDIARWSRPAVLLYGGDFNPDGIGIERDFIRRTDCWRETHRVVTHPRSGRGVRVTAPTREAERHPEQSLRRGVWRGLQRRHGRPGAVDPARAVPTGD